MARKKLDSQNFGFRIINDPDLCRKIRDYGARGFESQNDLLVAAVKNYFESGGKRKTLKDEKLEQEVIKLKLTNGIMLKDHYGMSGEQMRDYIEGHKDPQALTQIIDGTGGARCLTCGFEMDDASNYRNHIHYEHKRKLYESEKEALAKFAGCAVADVQD